MKVTWHIFQSHMAITICMNICNCTLCINVHLGVFLGGDKLPCPVYYLPPSWCCNGSH